MKIEEVVEATKSYPFSGLTKAGVCRLLNLILEIHKIEQDKTEQNWVPVSKKLPEDDNDVLVTDGEDYAVAYWRTDAHAWDNHLHGWCDLEVIAWKPFHEFCKEESEEQI